MWQINLLQSISVTRTMRGLFVIYIYIHMQYDLTYLNKNMIQYTIYLRVRRGKNTVNHLEEEKNNCRRGVCL